MLVADPVYGKAKIEEPVLLALLNSKEIKRLKGISLSGIPQEIYSFKDCSRYDHCLGVMILLKNLGATLEEQIAGLLHDVSTLAFSHIIDWAFADGKKGVEEYQNEIHHQFIKKTEIPEILEKYNFSVERILQEKNYTLLERKIPDLCADRLDYSFKRECYLQSSKETY